MDDKDLNELKKEIEAEFDALISDGKEEQTSAGDAPAAPEEALDEEVPAAPEETPDEEAPVAPEEEPAGNGAEEVSAAPEETPAEDTEEETHAAPEQAEAAEETQPVKPRRTGRKILIGVLCAVLLIAGALAIFINSKLNMINYREKGLEIEIQDIDVADREDDELDTEGVEVREEEGALPTGDVFSDENVINILLLGTDRRIPNTLDRGRADAVMLLSLNKTTGAIKLISFERAVSVPIPDRPNDLLTHSFNYGGAELTTQIIRECFLVDVVGYAHVDFDTFIEAVDAIGGIDVELTETEAKALNGEWRTNAWAKHKMVAGMNHLDGYDALQFARERYMDSDWHRVRRQRDVIQAVINKTKNASLTELNNMMNAVLPHIDTDLSKEEIASLMLLAPKFIGAQADQMTIPDKQHLWIYTGKYGEMYSCDFQWCADTIREFIYGE